MIMWFGYFILVVFYPIACIVTDRFFFERRKNMLLAVDPGAGHRQTIGVCVFDLDKDGALVEMRQMDFEEFDAYLLEPKQAKRITQIVYETYQIRRQFAAAHVGSKVEVVRSVGLLVAFAKRNNIPVAEQLSKILNTAALWFEVEWPMKNHDISHQVSAMLHGLYWMHQHTGYKTPLQVRQEIKNDTSKA